MSLSPRTLSRPRGFTAATRYLRFVNCMSMPRSVLLQQLHHGLQVVLVLAADPQLVALDGGLDLELRALDELDDLAGLLGGDALLQRDLLAHGAAERLVDRRRR